MRGWKMGVQPWDEVPVEDVILCVYAIIEIDLLDSACSRAKEELISFTGGPYEIIFDQFSWRVTDEVGWRVDDYFIM
jgi:hypothetical protein